MKVLVSDSIAQAGIDLLAREVEVHYEPGLKHEELKKRIGDHDALIVRSNSQVTSDILKAAPKLKVVGRAGVGVDNIDVEEATARGVLVVNVPGGNTISACEHTLGLLFAVARSIPQADAILKSGKWQRNCFMGVQLNGKVLGVIGTGKIGREVARRARFLGMDIIAYDPYISPDQCSRLDIPLVSLEELLSGSDFITLHCPLSKDTEGMIGRKELALMKPTARLINCARGSIVDEEALYEFLRDGRIAGAGLDVFASEPLECSPLFDLPNVVVTPHLGASTIEAQEYNAVYVAEQVVKALKGQPAESAVNQPRLSKEEWTTVQPILPLAEIMGIFFSQAFPGPVDEVELYFTGVDCSNLSIITSYLLKGLLREAVAFPLNHINAFRLARDRGIRVSETRLSDNSHRWILKLRAGIKNKTKTVSGNLTPSMQPRIVEMNGYPLEVAPSPHMLITQHFDKPGVIGKVGTLLGNRDINIATMQVGRQSLGGEAIMILQVDDSVPEDLYDTIAGIPGIQSVRSVSIPLDVLKKAGADTLVP